MLTSDETYQLAKFLGQQYQRLVITLPIIISVPLQKPECKLTYYFLEPEKNKIMEKRKSGDQ